MAVEIYLYMALAHLLIGTGYIAILCSREKAWPERPGDWLMFLCVVLAWPAVALIGIAFSINDYRERNNELD